MDGRLRESEERLARDVRRAAEALVRRNAALQLRRAQHEARAYRE